MLGETHPFWDAWSKILIGRPVTVLAVCLAVIAALGGVLAFTPVDLSFMGMLGEDEPEIIAIREQVETFGSSMMLMMLLEGEAEHLAEAVAVMEHELPKRAPIKGVHPPADPQWLIDRAPWLWPDPLFNAVLKDASAGTVSNFTRNSVELADSFIRHGLRPREDMALLSLEYEGNPLDMDFGGAIYKAVSEAAPEILSELGTGVEASFTGMAAIGAQDQISVLSRIKVITPLTLVVVMVLMLGIETRPTRVLVTGFALASSVVIAYGMVGLVLGRLTIATTFFGMLLLGLGIDFGIHLLVSLRDGRASGLSPEESLKHGVHHTGTAIVLGGISTGLAFGIVALAPDAVARDMGLSALFGLTAALILMLSFVPAAWLLLEKRRAGAEKPSRLNLSGLRAVVGFSLAHPKAVVFCAFVLAVAGMTGIPRYSHETNLEKIFSRNVPALDVARRLQATYGGSSNYYLAPAESLEQAREWAAELRKLPDVAQVVSVSDFVSRESETRRKAILDALDKDVSPESTEVGLLFKRLRKAIELGPITLENLPPVFSAGLVGTNGELAVRIVPKEDLMEAHALVAQIERIRSIAPTATGIAMLIPLATVKRRDYVPIMIPSVLFVVTVVLAIAFRKPRDVFLALLPVSIGTTITFGAFFWMGLQFSVLTTIVVPVILGLGVDDGIHVVERLRRYKTWNDDSIHAAVEGVGRPIFLTTATTCVSFAGLLLLDHAGLESIAKFMLIGLPLCFVTSITVLPAAAKILAQAGVK